MHFLRRVKNKVTTKMASRKAAVENRRWVNTPAIETIKQIIPGVDTHKKNKRICLFAHFDIQGRVDPYVMNYIDEIKRNGFDVVLITTSQTIDSRDFKEVSARCRYYIHRQNVGLDFGSWKTAMDHLKDFREYEELLLTNDSVFGPIYSLSETFKKLEQMPQQVCGLLDTWEIYYHLQSYFLFFKHEALKSEQFASFWQNFKLSTDKDWIINNYEIGLSQHFLRNGFELGSCIDFVELRDYCINQLGEEKFQYHDKYSREPGNPTLFAWDVLINEQFRFPFIKTELLKYNRLHSNKVVNWRHFMPDNTEHLIKLFSNFLKRTQWNSRGC